ncbi:hypothetical protein IVA87_08745 [Bradyrhizobium sp. 147]|uniref:hypothetical protein n=1 Tax=Bradyrhizobium sp. 147 TaxID=2782623 RepID=UPI001FFAFB78|nr:hypothetical protein [Bradyrhizobium sp. 147]MCK1679547.1 hypothetical protein [Bradyrhizobium sp. 147]
MAYGKACWPLWGAAANDAWINILGITDDASFVNFFAGDADVGGGRPRVSLWNAREIVADAGNFTPLLRRVVLVGETALRSCFDLKRICMRAIGSLDLVVGSLFRPIEMGRPSS